jgi:uncharacterized hydrophobic protein (TIGR00271 family)
VTLHIRAVSPPGATDALVTAVAAIEGVARLVVLPGAHRPEGDAVQFDVTSSAANAVLARLRDLAIPADVQPVDTVLPAGPAAPAPRLLARDQPPVWALVEAHIRNDAVYAPSFYLLLVFAGLIAATGILTNSQILIVGAMVVGPEYGAIISVALGIDRAERTAITSGLLALLAGFTAAILVCLVFGLCVRGLGRTPHLYSTGLRPVSDLINSPNLFSVIVAVVAGMTGVVSLTGSRAGALVGVFISVTTIPAAAEIGLSAAYGSWSELTGALLQLLLNVVLLIAVGAGGLRLQRRIWHRHGRGGRAESAGTRL